MSARKLRSQLDQGTGGAFSQTSARSRRWPLGDGADGRNARIAVKKLGLIEALFYDAEPIGKPSSGAGDAPRTEIWSPRNPYFWSAVVSGLSVESTT
jgi:hypothetical protein